MSETTESAAKETTTITAHRPFAAMIRAIADRRDITMAEALERYALAAIMREYRKVLDEMQAVLGGEGG